jgi:tryptophanyl-tRNA synthetase
MTLTRSPALANLLTIYSHCAGVTIPEIEAMYSGKGYADFKAGLAEVIVETLRPIQAKFADLKKSGELREILFRGAIRANESVPRP